MKSSIAAVVALGLSTAIYAQSVASNCPETNLCYSLNIPESTAQSGNGDIYFQISAPTTYQWAALGQGSAMAGSNIFVMYTSANGQNVTVSPRLGVGHVEPLHDTSAQITLLDGSGVTNNMMVANVKCSNCQDWSGGSMDFTGSSAEWIYAYKSGSALNSDDLTADIKQHDDAEPFSWDLTKAKGGNSANPFVTAASSAGTSNGTSSTTTTTTTGDTSSSSSNSSGGDMAFINAVTTAHGALAGIAFVAIFPSGSILIRIANFTGLVWVHAALQALGLAVFIAAFGLGVYLARQMDLISNYHPIIGIVLFAVLLIQPLTGLVHHGVFKKTAKRTAWSWEHIGIGRIAILLGIINGGLGLNLAGSTNGEYIAYGVCAGVVGVVYIVVIIVGEIRRKRRLDARPGSNGKGEGVQTNETVGQKA